MKFMTLWVVLLVSAMAMGCESAEDKLQRETTDMENFERLQRYQASVSLEVLYWERQVDQMQYAIIDAMVDNDSILEDSLEIHIRLFVDSLRIRRNELLLIERELNQSRNAVSGR